jgi:elongator complex protein 4
VAGQSTGATVGTAKPVGAKPWINGGYLVSSGNRQLDELIGGGQALGTLLFIEADCFSSYSDTFIGYGLAQALGLGHNVFLGSFDATASARIIESLPFNQNLSRTETGVDSTAAPDKTGDNVKTHESSSEPQTNDHSAAHLKIAWQYQKYIKDGN